MCADTCRHERKPELAASHTAGTACAQSCIVSHAPCCGRFERSRRVCVYLPKRGISTSSSTTRVTWSLDLLKHSLRSSSLKLYDVNVLSTQRINRAVLPLLRKQGRGLVVWVGSSSTRGGTPPYLGPYFAAKAGMDAMAVSYAGELARWNIETTIVVPGRHKPFR